MSKKRRKTKDNDTCCGCIFLCKDEDDWFCNNGHGFVEPWSPACNEKEQLLDGTHFSAAEGAVFIKR